MAKEKQTYIFDRSNSAPKNDKGDLPFSPWRKMADKMTGDEDLSEQELLELTHPKQAAIEKDLKQQGLAELLFGD